jgi:hypothetical protein
MITYTVESLRHCLNELKPLFQPHWEELALDKTRVPLDPQYPEYLKRDAAGGVLAVIARDQGEIVGYFIGFIAPGLHYQTCLTLTMDIFWLRPEYRDGDSLEQIEGEMVAQDLFARVKQEALRRGVQRAFFGSKMHKDVSFLFESLGMREVERYYSAYWGE